MRCGNAEARPFLYVIISGAPWLCLFLYVIISEAPWRGPFLYVIISEAPRLCLFLYILYIIYCISETLPRCGGHMDPSKKS